MLVLTLLIFLGFVLLMCVWHNDSLAAKGIEFAGQVLAALLTLMVSGGRAAKATPPEEK
jgi:hypothetical protein